MFGYKKLCVPDYETFSEVDLKKCGASVYAQHGSTEILCVAFASGTLENLKEILKKKSGVKYWFPKKEWNDDLYSENKNLLVKNISLMVQDFLDDDVLIVAHNAFFEMVITKHVLPKMLAQYGYFSSKTIEKLKNIPVHKFWCSAALALSSALPKRLEHVTEALGLNYKKDKKGHSLMLRWSKPRKPSKNNPSTRYTENFKRLLKYCVNDIYAEIDVILNVPNVPMSEKELWNIDQEMNHEGILIDRKLIRKIKKLVAEETVYQLEKLKSSSKGKIDSINKRDKILKFLKREGVDLPDLKSKTVKDFLASDAVEDASEDAVEVLKIRDSIGKTSLKKYDSLLNFSSADSYFRGALQFHAASTGRWGGVGPQPQNFPRPTIEMPKNQHGEKFDQQEFLEYMIERIHDGITIEEIRLITENPFDLFVSLLRSVMISDIGYDFMSGDYSSIEARLVLWIAGQEDMLQAYREGRKIYEEMAMVIFGIKLIGDVDSFQRFVGKQTVLGSGFGMGFAKFAAQCEQYGQPVSTSLAKKAIQSYRKTNYKVPQAWRNIEEAAIRATLFKDKKFSTNKVTFFYKGDYLCCKLPSGRCLRYYKAEVKYQNKFGKRAPILYFYGVDSKTKKWKLQKTWGGTLLENIVQAVARDLMAEAIKGFRKTKTYFPKVTVHDEILNRVKEGQGSEEEFIEIMSKIPEWAKGAPVAVEVWRGKRYRK